MGLNSAGTIYMATVAPWGGSKVVLLQQWWLLSDMTVCRCTIVVMLCIYMYVELEHPIVSL